MKESLLYLLLIALVGYVLYDLWFIKEPTAFIQNGVVLFIAIIIYYLIPHREKN